MKVLLKGGTVVNGESCRQADVLIEDEKIAEVGADLQSQDAQVIDVRGKLLFPGFIDAHTHFDLEVAGTVTADNFKTGTRAALLGGTTMVIDFATQYKGETLKEALANWHKKADGQASCDYSFHMSVADWNENVSRELQDMIDEGITSFKLYMTYDAMKVNDRELYEILKRLKELGGIAGVHCENSGLVEALQTELKAAGNMDVSSHPKSRPAEAEAEAINRLLRIAEVVDTPVIIVHLTCKEGFDVIMQARERGQKVYIETCPQYLLLDDSRYALEGLESYKYVIAPPLRKKADNACLWDGLGENEIQTVCTDHCSFTMAQKMLGKDDFTKIPGGMPGVETRGVLMYNYGVKENRISLTQMCRVLSENPAKLYGVYPQKGCIACGSDADIVVFDPEANDVIRAEDQIQNTDYAPFEGFPVSGRIESVFLRGRLVVDKHKNIVDNAGCYIPRKGCSL